MKQRKVHLTGQIKPATRNAVLDQLAEIADGIIGLRAEISVAYSMYDELVDENFELQGEYMRLQRRWWHRFAWWR